MLNFECLTLFFNTMTYNHIKVYIGLLLLFSHLVVSNSFLCVCVQLFVTQWAAACQAFLSFTTSGVCSNLSRVKSQSDAIHPSHPLSSPSPLAFSLSQHQGLSQWVSSLHQVAKVWSFSFSNSPSMNIQGWFPLGLTGWISLKSMGLSRVFSNTTVQRHQFFGTQPKVLTLLWKF